MEKNMENEMETREYTGISRVVDRILGVVLGLYWDTGKENGNYYLGFRVYSPP